MEDGAGLCPLHYAAERGSTSIANLLLAGTCAHECVFVCLVVREGGEEGGREEEGVRMEGCVRMYRMHGRMLDIYPTMVPFTSTFEHSKQLVLIRRGGRQRAGRQCTARRRKGVRKWCQCCSSPMPMFLLLTQKGLLPSIERCILCVRARSGYLCEHSRVPACLPAPCSSA